jgi:hypothetical protein
LKIGCVNCGAEIGLERDEPFFVCPFCNSSLFLDRAKTFKDLLFLPLLPAAAARSKLAEELARREIPACAIQEVRPLLVPFWGVRGEALQETVAAFSPVPVGLQGYRLPSAESVFFSSEAAEGFEPMPCAEAASAVWQGRKDVSSFSLYRVPFFRVSFSAGAFTYEGWVDAVSGRVLLTQTPPPVSAAISSRFLALVFTLFGLFTLVAAVVPGFGWSLVAVGALAAASVPVVKRLAAGGQA